MAKEDKMIMTVRQKSDEKVEYLKKVVDEMIRLNLVVTPYTVWKRSGLSKAFIYNNSAAKDYINKHRSPNKYNLSKVTSIDILKEEIINLRNENKNTAKLLMIANEEYYSKLEEENKQLKTLLQKYTKLFAKLKEQGIISEDISLD